MLQAVENLPETGLIKEALTVLHAHEEIEKLKPQEQRWTMHTDNVKKEFSTVSFFDLVPAIPDLNINFKAHEDLELLTYLAGDNCGSQNKTPEAYRKVGQSL